MRYLILLIVLVGFVGCTNPPPAAPPAQLAATPVDHSKQPEVPDQKPTPPTNPTKSYIKGYHDGYYGTWLAPGRWMVKDEYRAGWSAGSYDRVHHLPNQHPSL